MFREMNEEVESIISEALRVYRRIYKSPGSVEQRWPGLTEWIARNKDQYSVGRVVDKNAEHRLGQWYITFTLLFPAAPIPVHPFYDLSVTGGTLVGETFIQIVEGVTRITIEQNGPPAAGDAETMIRYVVSIAEASAGIASRTTLRDFNNSRSVPSVAPRPS